MPDMNVDDILDLGGAIVLLAMISVVVTSPNTSRIIRESGAAFGNALKAATGR